jgi:hypothetical protein
MSRAYWVKNYLLVMGDKGQLQLSGASKKQLEALPAFIYAE